MRHVFQLSPRSHDWSLSVLNQVRDMLASSNSVAINVQQKPDMTDHEYVEEQERRLQTLCVRTMALSLGRGQLWDESCRHDYC